MSFFAFFRAAVQCMEVPSLGVELELQPLGIQVMSASLWPTSQFMAPPRSLTHWVRPVIEPTSSQILVGFVTTEPQWEFPKIYITFFITFIYMLKHSFACKYSFRSHLSQVIIFKGIQYAIPYNLLFQKSSNQSSSNQSL